MRTEIKKLGLSTVEVAKKTGLSQPLVSMQLAEPYARGIGGQSALKYVRAFGLDYEKLLVKDPAP